MAGLSLGSADPAGAPARTAGSRAYLGSLMVAQACALLRYAALARILGPQQLGLAAIIVLTGQFFDSLTDAGTDRFLIQDQHGHGTAAFRLVELVAAMRGVAMAVMIVLLAGPVAEFAHAPEVVDALRVFAIIPLIGGFTNYDFRAAQRDHDFLPEARLMAASEFAGLVATISAGLLLRNFTAILYGLATRALVAVVLSHVVARRHYAVGYDAELAGRLWRFGAPLMINGLLLFAATQSDRVIISRTLGVTELGRYSVVLLPILYPSATLLKYLATLYLPLLSGARHEPTAFSQVGRNFSGLSFALSAGLAVGFALVAPPVLPIIFGKGFSQSSTVVALVGVLLSLRLVKVAPTTAALAMGATTIPPLNNVLRLTGIACAILGVQTIGGLAGIVTGLIVGEIVANVAATLLVNRRAGWPLSRDAARYAYFILLCGVIVARGVAADRHLEWETLVTSLAALLMLLPYCGTILRTVWNRPHTPDDVSRMDEIPLESGSQ